MWEGRALAVLLASARAVPLNTSVQPKLLASRVSRTDATTLDKQVTCPLDSTEPECNCCRTAEGGVGGCEGGSIICEVHGSNFSAGASISERIGSCDPVLGLASSPGCGPSGGAAPPYQLPADCASFPSRRSVRIFVPHIGKTAGSALGMQLAISPINFTYAHLGPPTGATIDPSFDVFIVATRDPVSRTISAFNWRHTDGGGDFVRGIVESEKALYACNMDYPGGADDDATHPYTPSDPSAHLHRILHRPIGPAPSRHEAPHVDCSQVAPTSLLGVWPTTAAAAGLGAHACTTLQAAVLTSLRATGSRSRRRSTALRPGTPYRI